MVYYYKSSIVDPPAEIYVGKHKEENEDLIKYGWEGDVWYVPYGTEGPQTWDASTAADVQAQFHVDNLSSAHVYLRLKAGDDWSNVPKDLLEDCAQLTKANSIDGNKKDNIIVIYTPWSNLRKDASMAVGQVSFHNPHSTHVRKLHIPRRDNAIVNRLNKTRTEAFPDLKSLRDVELKRKSKEERIRNEEKKRAEKKEREERERLKYSRDHAYEELQDEDRMKSNQDVAEGEWDDDFM